MCAHTLVHAQPITRSPSGVPLWSQRGTPVVYESIVTFANIQEVAVVICIFLVVHIDKLAFLTKGVLCIWNIVNIKHAAHRANSRNIKRQTLWHFPCWAGLDCALIYRALGDTGRPENSQMLKWINTADKKCQRKIQRQTIEGHSDSTGESCCRESEEPARCRSEKHDQTN